MSESNTLLQVNALLGPALSLFIAGFSASASGITMPALYALPASSSMIVVQSLFIRGGPVAAPFGIMSAVCSGTAAYLLPRASTTLRGATAVSDTPAEVAAQKRMLYITAAVLAVSNFAWTRLVMVPSINRVLEIANSKALQASVSAAEASGLLWKWQWQNYVRTGISTLAAAIGFYAFAS